MNNHCKKQYIDVSFDEKTEKGRRKEIMTLEIDFTNQSEERHSLSFA